MVTQNDKQSMINLASAVALEGFPARRSEEVSVRKDVGNLEIEYQKKDNFYSVRLKADERTVLNYSLEGIREMLTVDCSEREFWEIMEELDSAVRELRRS